MHTEFWHGDDMSPTAKSLDHSINMPGGNSRNHANDKLIEPIMTHTDEKKITPEESDALLDWLDSLTPLKSNEGLRPGQLPAPQPPPGERFGEKREVENYADELNHDILKGCNEIMEGDLLMLNFTDSHKQHITISAVTSGYIISIKYGPDSKMYWDGSTWIKNKIILPYSKIKTNAGE